MKYHESYAQNLRFTKTLMENFSLLCKETNTEKSVYAGMFHLISESDRHVNFKIGDYEYLLESAISITVDLIHFDTSRVTVKKDTGEKIFTPIDALSIIQSEGFGLRFAKDTTEERTILGRASSFDVTLISTIVAFNRIYPLILLQSIRQEEEAEIRRIYDGLTK